VPKFEFELGQVAACCGSVVTVEIRDGDIHARCSCHRVSVDAEDGRQLWCNSFEAAYCELTGRPWEGET
jgi:hypothetical protein